MDSTYGDALSKKADTDMYEDEDDDRFEAALRLAEHDPAWGAEALRSIVADDAFDPDTRFEAAARLAEVDEAQAAEALRSIVADDAFDPDTRSEAAARLADADSDANCCAAELSRTRSRRRRYAAPRPGVSAAALPWEARAAHAGPHAQDAARINAAKSLGRLCGVVARVDAVLAQDRPQLVQLGVYPA